MLIRACLRYLLYPQTQVEDAVGAVGLTAGTSHLLDEAGQSHGELGRVAEEDVFLDGDWSGTGERDSVSAGRGTGRCVQERVELRLTVCRALVPLQDPAPPGLDPVQRVDFGCVGNCLGGPVRCTGSPAALDGQKSIGF